MSSESAEYVVVVQLVPPSDGSSPFPDVLDGLREFFEARGPLGGMKVYGAMGGDAERVLGVFEPDEVLDGAALYLDTLERMNPSPRVQAVIDAIRAERDSEQVFPSGQAADQ